MQSLLVIARHHHISSHDISNRLSTWRKSANFTDQINVAKQKGEGIAMTSLKIRETYQK